MVIQKEIQQYIQKRLAAPFQLIALLVACYLAICMFQRAIYIGWIFSETRQIPKNTLWTFLVGIPFDLVVAFYLFLPLSTWLILVPSRLTPTRFYQWVTLILVCTPLTIATFTVLSEGFFFNEFHSRFNFIAVDYLVYSHEVFNNIWESFPVLKYLLLYSLFVIPILFVIARISLKARAPITLRARVGYLLFLSLWGGSALAFNGDRILDYQSFWNREVSKNSLHALFSAYFSNSIDFHQFYTSLEPAKAFHLTHEWLENDDQAPQTKEDPLTEDETSIVRNILPKNQIHKWNVITVVIESLSARFMGSYGNPNGLTPNLDRLAREGIFFDHLYATGTRTVRGLEALLLSLPPTPGQSILRRPNSDGLFNVGSVFKDLGYAPQFIYGGYAYFDNMKEWFEGNGFGVVDRAVISKDDTHFANAWGVCDEDLFDEVIKQADARTKENRNFFHVVLTTSNHRPYTFPDGRIDLPSGSGRDGAVKYTDYAIGRFIELASKRPWFKNTLFVFVADHNAAVAGGTDIPINDYLIPMMFYNPNLVSPLKVSQLASQADFAPSLLGLLGFPYQSRFFGQDLFRAKAGRAFLGTYQKVAMLIPGQLTILSPGHLIEAQILDESGNVAKSEVLNAAHADDLAPEIRLAVAIYQTASDLYTSGMDKERYRFSHSTNIRPF